MKTFLMLLVAAGMGVVGWRLGNDRVPIEIPTRDGIREAAAAGNLGLQPFERKDTLRVTGEVQPAEQTEVKGEVGGRIKTVRVRPGDQVKTGDVLMEIDNLEADLAAEDVQLTKATVRAPTDGSIVSVPVIQGQIIAPPAEGRGGTVLATVADRAKLLVAAHVPIDGVSGLVMGQRVALTASESPETKMNAMISFIAPIRTVKGAVEGYEIAAVIEETRPELRPGMAVELQIPGATPKAAR